jgi:hypothetical protein
MHSSSNQFLSLRGSHYIEIDFHCQLKYSFNQFFLCACFFDILLIWTEWTRPLPEKKAGSEWVSFVVGVARPKVSGQALIITVHNKFGSLIRSSPDQKLENAGNALAG